MIPFKRQWISPIVLELNEARGSFNPVHRVLASKQGFLEKVRPPVIASGGADDLSALERGNLAGGPGDDE